MSGVCLFLQLDGEYHHKDVYNFKVACALLSIVGTLLQLMSGCFILFSVFTIRRLIKKGLRPYALNERNLALHAAAFLLYSVGLIA